MAYSIENDEAEQRATMWQNEAEIAQVKVIELEQQLKEAEKQVKNIAYEPVLDAVTCDCCGNDLTNKSRLCIPCAMNA